MTIIYAVVEGMLIGEVKSVNNTIYGMDVDAFQLIVSDLNVMSSRGQVEILVPKINEMESGLVDLVEFKRVT